MTKAWIHIAFGSALVLLAALQSCTKVDFEHSVEVESDLPVETMLQIDYDWSVLDSVSIFNKPDTMCVALSRIVDEIHYFCQTDTAGTLISHDSIIVDNGAYYVLAFNIPEENVAIEGLDSFIENHNASMGNINVTIPHLPVEKKREKYPDMTADYNSSLEYIEPVPAIYFDTFKYSFSPEDSVGVITIRPKPLTQKVVFNFQMALEGDVRIDGAYGALSGVTESIELISGIIQNTDVFQTVVEFSVSDTPIRKEEKDGKIYNVYLMSGEVNTFGIIPPETDLDRRGPGILNMTIKAGLGEKGHSYHLGLNLHGFIKGEEFIEFQPNGNKHRLKFRNTPSYYDYPATMYLSEDFVLECTEVGGAEIWEHDENNDFEIEI